MKRIVLLIALVAALALCAGAQTDINFQQMPLVQTPTLMPDSYPEGMNLYWNSFYYVTPGLWSGAGPGFWIDPATQHNTVAFIGGPTCNSRVPCSGSIKLNPIVLAPLNRTFTPVSISLSAGWLPNRVTVMAYNNSRFVGSVVWNLGTIPQTFTFPTAWNVTQLVFTPDFINMTPVNHGAASMVVYDFTLIAH